MGKANSNPWGLEQCCQMCGGTGHIVAEIDSPVSVQPIGNREHFNKSVFVKKGVRCISGTATRAMAMPTTICVRRAVFARRIVQTRIVTSGNLCAISVCGCHFLTYTGTSASPYHIRRQGDQMSEKQ